MPTLPTPTVSMGAALSCVIGLNVARGGDQEISRVAQLLGVAPPSKVLGRGEVVHPVLVLADPLIRAKLRVAALERWPELGNETGAGVNRENWRGWLSKREAIYGATLPLVQAVAS